MHDEQTDQERKKAEGGEIEVKTVGQAGEIAIIIRRDEPQSIAGDWLKPRLVECLLIEDNESRELSGSIEQALRDADVDDDCAGRRFGERRKRRELLSAFGLRLCALRKIKPAQGLRGGKAAAWTGKEIFDHIRSRPPVGDRRAARQRQRFDADDPNILFANSDCAFQHRRDLTPARRSLTKSSWSNRPPREATSVLAPPPEIAFAAAS